MSEAVRVFVVGASAAIQGSGVALWKGSRYVGDAYAARPVQDPGCEAVPVLFAGARAASHVYDLTLSAVRVQVAGARWGFTFRF